MRTRFQTLPDHTGADIGRVPFSARSNIAFVIGAARYPPPPADYGTRLFTARRGRGIGRADRCRMLGAGPGGGEVRGLTGGDASEALL